MRWDSTVSVKESRQACDVDGKGTRYGFPGTAANDYIEGKEGE